MTGLFVGQRRDRLGARILMMLNCMRLAESYGADWAVNWMPEGADAPELEDPELLFDPNWIARRFVSNEDLAAAKNRVVPIWRFTGDDRPAKLNRHLKGGGVVLVDEGFELLTLPWEEPYDAETLFPRYLSEIGFSAPIRERMALIDRTLGQGPSTAYHIRRGDILNVEPWKHTPWRAKIEPEELYDAHIEANPGAVAMIFSDQPETLHRMRERHPHLKGVDDIVDLSGLPRAQRDFVELYAMSRANKIVAPPISAFSSAAARLRGKTIRKFRAELTEAQVDAANERVLERLSDFGNFIDVSEAAHLFVRIEGWLNAKGRTEEAHAVVRRLDEAGADNAFVKLLRALQAFYRGMNAEADECAAAALANPHLWPEDHATLLAVHAGIQGARNRPWRAALELSRAFWAKPLKPDVQTIASRLLYRDQLAHDALPPFDYELTTRVKGYFPRNNTHLAVRNVLGRRLCAMETWLIDWPGLVIDHKAARITGDRKALRDLRERMDRAEALPQDSFEAFAPLIETYLGGEPAAALTRLDALHSNGRLATLVRKRQADILVLTEDGEGALTAVREVVAADRNAFTLFRLAEVQTAFGNRDGARETLEEAARVDPGTAAIHDALAEARRDAGDDDGAAEAWTRASEITPTYKAFANRARRARQSAEAQRRKAARKSGRRNHKTGADA